MKPIKVLIVEDDPMVVEITKEFIKDDPDFQVIGIAVNGTDAVNFVREQEPDLVLLDNFLPCFNGATVIEKIRVFNKKVDFIMITAAKEIPVVQECFRLGIRDYLIKPYLKQRFLQSLQKYKEFYLTLNQPEVSQKDLDRIIAAEKNDSHMQKGFSQMTEDKMIEFLQQNRDGVTAEDIASRIGVTTVSARRYLKLLQDKDMVRYDLIYGRQGRPTYLYFYKDK
ncbi:MAG TPA: response regulator [Bacillota bacterium]|nr:response regulator [Bacillota bacterium]